MTTLLNGAFVNTPNYIYLAVPGVTPLCLESLRFMSDDYSCAVLWISCPYPGPSFWYELRVRNTSITTGPRQECLQYFKNMSGPYKGVYNSSCQDMLQTASVF
uniref:p27 protein-like protein n=1 Tax=Amblyomma americanum TaxID=6943 RepID=B5M7B7_AMBAM